MSDVTIIAIRQGESTAGFSAVDHLCLCYADSMTQDGMTVDDALFQELRQHFSEAQLVELTAVIAWENFRARFNHAFALEAEGYYHPIPAAVYNGQHRA